MLLTAVFLQISKSALQQIMFVTALKMDNLDCTKIKCTFQKFHSLSTGGAFSQVVLCPDPTLMEKGSGYNTTSRPTQ